MWFGNLIQIFLNTQIKKLDLKLMEISYSGLTLVIYTMELLILRQEHEKFLFIMMELIQTSNMQTLK